MAKRLAVNPTMAGALSVLIWGCALPIVKVVEDQVGLLAFMGFSFTAMVVFGAIHHAVRRRPLPPKAVFRSRYFYARWSLFVLHEGLLTTGIYLVQKTHMPFVILINYLWPTAIILFSVVIGVVTIRRWWAFLLGSSIVILSMVYELIGPSGVASDVFLVRRDCVAYAAAFIGAMSWGLYCALSRREGEASGGASVLPVYQATLGLALPVSFLPGMATWSRLTPGAGFLLLAYCFLLFVAYLAWDAGMQHGNVVVLTLMADLIPWLSLAAASLMLQVSIGSRAIVSAVVLVMGAMIARYGTLPSKPIPAAYEEPGI